MVVADTSAIIALVDRAHRDHRALRDAFEAAPDRWLLPSAILPEVDYLLSQRLGAEVARGFREDLAAGAFVVEWGTAPDLRRAVELDLEYAGLSLGLVDALVMAVAERVGATAIATLDLRDFASVELEAGPALWPRDL